ncbi:hypothetical protein BsWGS_02422 [Bradybaena similaris]
MTRYNIEILGISELKWTGMGHFITNEHYVYYSGHTQYKKNGVAFIVTKQAATSVIGYTPFNDRIITIRLKGQPTNVTIVQVYAPTAEADIDEREQFYNTIQTVIDQIPSNDILFIMGDFNAKVGEEITQNVTGRFGLGTRNEAGENLVNFCAGNDLYVANTMFQQPKRRLYTWTSPNGLYRNQIDYFLCANRWKSSVVNCKTLPGAECGTDHELLIAEMKIKLKRKPRVIRPPKFNIDCITNEYKTGIKDRFKDLDFKVQEPNEIWEDIKDIIKDEAEKHLPKKIASRKSKWLSEETVEIAQRRHAKSQGDKTTVKELNAKFQREARKDKEHFLNAQCKEIEEFNQAGSSREMF